MLQRIWESLFNNGPLLITLTVLFWSGNMVVGRYIVGTIPPITLAYIRWSIAILILLPFAWPHLKRDLPKIWHAKWHILILSFFGITLYNTITYSALTYTEALNTTLMSSTMPLLIAVISWLLFRDKMTMRQMLSVIISGLGVVIIFARGSLENLQALHFNIGDLLVMIAYSCYAFYTSYLRKRPDIHWLSFLAITFIIGNALLTPAMVLELMSGAKVIWNQDAFLVLAYVSIVPSILAYIFFNRGVALIGANRASIFFHLIPFFGAGLSTLILGEKFHLFHLAGGFLILLGVAISLKKSAPPQKLSSPS